MIAKKNYEDEKKEVVQWLAHPNELGKEPSSIEFTNEFTTEDGINCIIFKFKKSLFSPWMLAIKSDSGTFSNMEAYNKATEIEDAKKLVEFLKQYWKNLANDADDREEREKNQTEFVASVLLKNAVFEFEKFEEAYKEEWGTELKETKKSNDGECESTTENVKAKIYSVDGGMIVLGFMDFKVPNEEAESWAKYNYMWKDGVEITSTHTAHIIVSVLSKGSAEEKAVLYTKAVSALCKLENTLGVYADRIVYSPDFFYKASMMIKDGELPIFNTVWFGIGKEVEGVSAWTSGLVHYGKDEIEIMNSNSDPMEIRDFMFNIVQYVIGDDVILHDGETIGLSAEQRLKITRSEGLNVPGMSLKIDFE